MTITGKAVGREIEKGMDTSRYELLSTFGYKVNDPVSKRRMALVRVVKSRQNDGLETFQKLQPIIIWNKNRNPEISRRARSDQIWLKQRFKGTKDWQGN